MVVRWMYGPRTTFCIDSWMLRASWREHAKFGAVVSSRHNHEKKPRIGNTRANVDKGEERNKDIHTERM